MSVPVWHYDGKSAVRQRGTLIDGGSTASLTLETGARDEFVWADLIDRGTGRGGGRASFTVKGRHGWQFGFDDPPPPDIAAKLPRAKKYGGIIDKIGIVPASGVFLAVSALVVFVTMKAPEAIAPLIPFSWEKKLGDAMVGDMGGRFCNGPGGQAALDKLVARIDGKASDIRVRVANISMVNAVALPGGNIVIFRGLLQEAKSGDELAGVVAHEIGHVRNRDVMQALLRATGLSILLGGADGNMGSGISALVSATYSREAEARADAYSITRLQLAKVSPDDTAGFFTRMAKQEAKLGEAAAAIGYMSSHPLSESREKAFRQSKRPGAAYTPVIGADEWDALLDICHNDPKVAPDTGLFF